MKRIVSVLLIVISTVLLLTSNINAADNTANECSFFISIYNDINQTFALENTKITTDSKLTVIKTLDILKEKQLISDFTLNENELISIKVDDDKIDSLTSSTKTEIFYTKLNGKKLAIDDADYVIQNGDIIEWIYGDISEKIYIPENIEKVVQTKASSQTLQWTDDAQSSIESGCEFLTLNQELSENYIIALGCSGKSADVKMVNNLLSNIRKTQKYKSSTQLTKNILSLTFCGYDASELIYNASNYEDIDKQGIIEPIRTLIAYDSKNYIIENDSPNSRDKLIDIILANQKDTGGFSNNKDTDEDVDTTSMAITALSTYIDKENVKSSIDKAVKYLAENQTKTGGFGFEENSESLSQVIIALSSIGIDVDDSRFLNNKKTLLENLLEYKNSDGGFCKVRGETSKTSATEKAIIALSSIKKNGNPYKYTKMLSMPPKTKTSAAVSEVKYNSLITICFIGLAVIIVLIVLVASIVKTKTKNGEI